jgi:hypothetical protein
MEMTSEHGRMRELDSRSADGVEVTLLWEPHTNGVFIEVVDARTGDRFQVRLDPSDALDAFTHPYVYDGRRDRDEDVANGQAQSEQAR